MVYSKIRFPNQWMILLLKNIKNTKPEGPYEFRIAPSMTKIEIKGYLEKIYNVKVTEVHTANYLGKWKRTNPFYNRKKKLPDWKKAWVKIIPEAQNVPLLADSTQNELSTNAPKDKIE